MPEILFGALVVAGILFFRQKVTGVDLGKFTNKLRLFGGGGLLIAGILAVALDRVGLAVLFIGLSWGIGTGGRGIPLRPGKPWRVRRWQQQVRHAKTRFLAVEINARTGGIRGWARRGGFAGQCFDDVDLPDLLIFRSEVDQRSRELLDTYLDQRFGSIWRTRYKDTQWDKASLMSRMEAYAILGLDNDGSPEQIRAAHRRLMLLSHPDKGGSHADAIRINRARDVLLG